MKRFTELTIEQKLLLSAEELYLATEIEAAFLGIEIPLSLESIFQKYNLSGYTTPPESKTFYEIVKPSSYRSEPTGIAFLTSEEANKAIQGAISIETDYKGIKNFNKGEFAVQELNISLFQGKSISLAIEESSQNTEEFDKLLEEFREEIRELKQNSYLLEVRKAKKEKFLTLANGNEEIAKNFWKNSETSDWPE